MERLRIAQEAASQRRARQQRHRDQPFLSPRPSTEAIRSKAATSRRNSTFSYSRRAQAPRSDADVDESQALRFLALPDKLKRLHFTQEELFLLTESSERALGLSVTADDGVSRQGTLRRRRESVASCARHYALTPDVRVIEDDWAENEDASAKDLEHESSDFENAKQEACRRESSYSTHSMQAPSSPGPASSATRRVSLLGKRGRYLTPLPLAPPKLLPVVPLFPSPNARKATSISQPQSPAITPLESTFEAKYYKDALARSKLRVYLASPERFDEALEFGFPTECPGIERSTSLASSRRDLQDDMDELSEANSKDDEDDSSYSGKSPRTPSGFQEYFDTPMTPGIPQEGDAQLQPLDGREMTLRLTLTRKDLRAPEEELYAFQRKQVSGVDLETTDPLALEALSICEDDSGAQGAFAVMRPSVGGLKRAWKSFRGR